MYTVDQIRHVHLEISSRCNAACPLCPRNLYGYPYNDGYIERDLTLADVQKIFLPEFVSQLTEIYINGNFGDAVMNFDTVPIIQYFREINSKLTIKVSTNAGARNSKFWQDLARLDCEVIFCIDGLEDTHSLYRQNTVYEVVLNNAATFIKAGGQAVWKMIDFDHNRHQQSTARQLSKELGFAKFDLVDHGRNQAPVFNKSGQLTHTIGKPVQTDFKKIYQSRTQDHILLEDITQGKTIKTIDCLVKKTQSVYVSSTGDVYPCCFLGFFPETYGHGHFQQAANEQLRSLVKNNNALTNSLKDCIEWFNAVEKTWNIDSFEQGRLVVCNEVCGLSK